MLTKKEQDKKDHEEIREYKSQTDKALFYVWFFSGLLLLSVGVFLIITKSVATGVTPADDMGMGFGRPTSITGWGAIIIGLLVFIASLFFRKNLRR